ncbi:MAG TPA: TIR domain-containing protein [Longimicrobium sp.]|nr:TIR domain-containing protein [Longimicrobium sp.]
MSRTPWKILVADDDSLFCRLVEERLKDDGHDVLRAASDQAAREVLRRNVVDLAVLDLQLKGDEPNDMSGLSIALNEAKHIPSLLITNHRKKDIEQFTGMLDRLGAPHSALPQIIYKHSIDQDPALIGLRAAIHDRLVPRVFVVHGHDTAVRGQVRAKLVELGLEPVVLVERPGMGPVFDKLRLAAKRMHFAIVILTGDDLGNTARKLKPHLESKDRQALAKVRETLKPRARQNVIFELGYFASLLGIDRVLVLYEDGVERPSDYEMLHVVLDDRGEWLAQMVAELKHAGVERRPYQPK